MRIILIHMEYLRNRKRVAFKQKQTAISKTRNSGTPEHRNTEHQNSKIPEHRNSKNS